MQTQSKLRVQLQQAVTHLQGFFRHLKDFSDTLGEVKGTKTKVFPVARYNSQRLARLWSIVGCFSMERRQRMGEGERNKRNEEEVSLVKLTL